MSSRVEGVLLAVHDVVHPLAQQRRVEVEVAGGVDDRRLGEAVGRLGGGRQHGDGHLAGVPPGGAGGDDVAEPLGLHLGDVRRRPARRLRPRGWRRRRGPSPPTCRCRRRSGPPRRGSARCAHVLVMYTTGSQPVAALALASSLRNVMHWAPSGTVMITSGAASARLETCACGGASSPSSTVSSATISRPGFVGGRPEVVHRDVAELVVDVVQPDRGVREVGGDVLGVAAVLVLVRRQQSGRPRVVLDLAEAGIAGQHVELRDALLVERVAHGEVVLRADDPGEEVRRRRRSAR